MHDLDVLSLSADEWDELQDPRPEECDFDRVVALAMSRRGFLSGLVAFGSGAAAMGLGAVLPGAAEASVRFGFAPIPAQTDGTVHVPEGYDWQVLVRWGDPLFEDVTAFDNAVGGAAGDADRVFGENTDGMELFAVGERHLIAVNHEYVNRDVNLPQRMDGAPENLEDVRKLQNLQGVTVMEVSKGAEGWQVVKDSPYTRRITQLTPMRISGPAAGHDLLKTKADPSGMEALGTFNNCGSGRTPWGTYLTCEENFNGYFGATDEAAALPEDYARYGIRAEGRGYDYHKYDARFDVSKNPGEPRRAGYVVEIDPADPMSVPVKRSALGRFKHENAALVLAPDGRVVVYLGDDERGEFLYKFISDAAYVPGGDTAALLDEGTLHVAQFHEDGTGQWLPLTPETTGMTLPEICILTRQAASKVGATTMDRPEWVAVNLVMDVIVTIGDKTVTNLLHGTTQVPVDFPAAPALTGEMAA